ncbi:CHAT domain-containing protein [Actinocrispum wychmicini]|uniref:CHAT domain-containing protein n=1 Tax=Actinocrispum wychmicini TaxID=1213861 RepID=A0A4R2J487_9PSEU|nr:CHAT domain-containing protein [Actinocrispum wychmicini]TCO52924.1 CHAT domain-containing protein [Actinocrispum wychmicini]
MGDEIARCQATVDRAATGDVESAEVAAFITDLARLPAGHPERSRLAATMVIALTKGGGSVPIALMGHLDGLLRLVEHVPSTLAIWPQVRTSARAQFLAYAAAEDLPVDLHAAEKELAELAETVWDVPAVKFAVEGALRTVRARLAAQAGDESAMFKSFQSLAPQLDQLGDHPVARTMRSVVEHMEQVMTAYRADDMDEAVRRFRELDEKVAELPDWTGMRDAFRKALPGMEILVDSARSKPVPGDPRTVAEEITKSLAGPDSQVTDQVRARLIAAGALFRGGEETDPERIDVAIEQCREAVALGEDHTQYPHALTTLALGLLLRSELAGSTAGLDEAEALLVRALDVCGGPQHPEWALANEMLAGIGHRTGDLAASGRFGLAAQRSYVWRALLESDAAGGRAAIRHAVRNAIELARVCLGANNVADAVRALDTGRGLMLYAEVELRNVPNRLKAAGRTDLAERWVKEGRDSEGLRREVMTTLLAHAESAGSLLDPPSLGQIRAALRVAKADALVYLVPAEASLPGLVVIAPREGKPAYMVLSHLEVKEEEVDRYLTALVNRSREIEPVDDGSFADRVDALCGWAWRAAIGPLLDRYFSRTVKDDRVPRIVLVPMGDLARIPWAAARRPDGTYAVELAAFSQAASARLFCDNAAKPPIKAGSTGLIVGDPATAAIPLKAARVEAYAIWQTFYWGARYVGRVPKDGSPSPSGAGTAEQVSDWLADAEPYAGTTLHLACHGLFTLVADKVKAALLLASGELDTDEIIRILAAVPERRIGLVVMAACHTGRSIHGYDEAYSLGSAFLAAGVRTVLSTQWAIPDETTPSLMFLFHHYLREERLEPWEALRKAQVWMLDPNSEPPERMPADLVAMAAGHDHTQVVSWAGFVHGGH